MYTDSAYWRNTKLDFKDKKHPLFVGSCGTYHLYTKYKLPTYRPMAGWIISFCILLPEKLIFILTEKKKFSLPETWYYTGPGKSSVIIITEPTIRKYTGFISPAMM